jgi:hypothetical protein
VTLQIRAARAIDSSLLPGAARKTRDEKRRLFVDDTALVAPLAPAARRGLATSGP